MISPWESIWSLGEGAGVSDDYHFITKFSSRGFVLHFLMPRARDEEAPALNGFFVHRYPNFFEATKRFPTPLKRILWPLLFQAIVLPRALLLARSIRPDFILGHSYHSSFTTFVAGRLFRLPSGVKLFGVMDLVHTEWPRWKYLYKNFEQILSLKIPQDVWIIIDDGTRGKEVALRLGVQEEKIHFLPNGTDLEWADKRFDREKIRIDLGIPLDACVVLFLARFVASKRPAELVMAIPRVLRSSEKRILFLFVGDGPERMKCQELAERLEVAPHTRFYGSVLHTRVPEIMSACDIFVSTSSLTNMAIPTCEAFICGLPAVAFDVGDTGKVVRNGETGLLVKDKDVEALASGIASLVNDEERRRFMGRAAHSFALKSFVSWSDRTEMEFNLIQSLLEKRSPH